VISPNVNARAIPTKRRKLGNNGSSILDPGSSKNNNRKKSTSLFGSSDHLATSHNQNAESEISFVVVDPDPTPPLSDGEQQRNQCEMSSTFRDDVAWSCLNLWPMKYKAPPNWRFNSFQTMAEIESMIEPGYFDGDRLYDPDCCNCDSCKIVWESVPQPLMWAFVGWQYMSF